MIYRNHLICDICWEQYLEGIDQSYRSQRRVGKVPPKGICCRCGRRVEKGSYVRGILDDFRCCECAKRETG